MQRVKQRNFMAQFGKYKTQEVEVIGRDDKRVGRYIPDHLLSKDDENTQQTEDALQSKSKKSFDELAYEVLEEGFTVKNGIVYDKSDNAIFLVQEELSDKEQKFQELKKKLEPEKEGQIDIEPKLIIEGFHETEEHRLVKDEFVGTCDICHNPSKELWEHEEDGIERNVCRNCFAVRMPEKTPAQFEEFLRTRKKVEPSVYPPSWTEHPLAKQYFQKQQAAAFKNFNPLPKPLKKEKKK